MTVREHDAVLFTPGCDRQYVCLCCQHVFGEKCPVPVMLVKCFGQRCFDIGIIVSGSPHGKFRYSGGGAEELGTSLVRLSRRGKVSGERRGGIVGTNSVFGETAREFGVFSKQHRGSEVCRT
ncbi:hypothetical protein [Escherichia phage ZCEC13]|uniref:Uncharacterized protein n=1 Tax=Escherichia phage ZCEC13 TaxID=2935866 RepID=A0AAE9HG41_9CAUD|nr:hypothetical protein [Escherichia phage ZCEC13]